MNDRGNRSDGRCGEDLAAYALGALAPAEAREVEQHLAGCAVCRDELAALQHAVEVLPLAVPQLRAPRGLKRRVMAEIRGHPSGAVGGSAAAHRGRLSPRPMLALAAGLVAAAALAAVLAVAGGGTQRPRTVRASVAPPGASALLSERGGSGTLIVRHMPQPPRGKIYEVWVERGSSAPSPTDALFGVTSTGAASVAVPGSLHGVSAVLVTPEPLGGSRAPTHAPVIVAEI